MKKSIILILAFLTSNAFFICAQQTDNQIILSSLTTQIDSAIQSEKFLVAADLVAERDLRLELERAINEEDFLKASQLKKQIEGKSTSPTNKLQEQLKQAIAREDYELAEKIQYEIENGAVNSSPPPELNHSSKNEKTDYHDDYYYSSRGDDTQPQLEIPEFVYQVYNRQVDGSLNNLEKVNGQLKTGGGGYGGFSARRTSYVIPGGNSRITLTKEQLNFVVRSDAGIDPADEIQLVQLDVKRRNRYAHISEGRTFGYGSSSNQVTDNLIRISFESTDHNVYSIKIHDQLAPGQYAFKNGKRFFAFTLN